MSVSILIKRVIKRGLQHVAAGMGAIEQFSQKPYLMILMYHRILPANDERTLTEEPGMIVTPETLRLHLEIAKNKFDIIKLSDWVKMKESGSSLPRRACAITFDDGWADNYEFAFPILKSLKIPATIYLTSSLISTDKKFWPERLSNLIIDISRNHSEKWSRSCLDWVRNSRTGYTFNDQVPTQDELAEIIDAAKHLPDQEIHSRIDKIELELSISTSSNQPSLLTWEQLDEMIKFGLIEAGSHTCHHVRLEEETLQSTVEYEIVSSKHEIEQHTGQTVSSFCYPNGDYCPKALELVRQHYSNALTTKSGRNTATTDTHLLYRYGIHQGNSYDRIAFLARISGWM